MWRGDRIQWMLALNVIRRGYVGLTKPSQIGVIDLASNQYAGTIPVENAPKSIVVMGHHPHHEIFVSLRLNQHSSAAVHRVSAKLRVRSGVPGTNRPCRGNRKERNGP